MYGLAVIEVMTSSRHLSNIDEIYLRCPNGTIILSLSFCRRSTASVIVPCNQSMLGKGIFLVSNGRITTKCKSWKGGFGLFYYTRKKYQWLNFACFWAYIEQSLDHIGWAKSMTFASINPMYLPKDKSMKFSQENFENWSFWKTQFFWIGHFGIFFKKKNAWSLWKSVTNYVIEWMGLNFSDFQQIPCYA
jgi:hypothetical protein